MFDSYGVDPYSTLGGYSPMGDLMGGTMTSPYGTQVSGYGSPMGGIPGVDPFDNAVPDLMEQEGPTWQERLGLAATGLNKMVNPPGAPQSSQRMPSVGKSADPLAAIPMQFQMPLGGLRTL